MSRYSPSHDSHDESGQDPPILDDLAQKAGPTPEQLAQWQLKRRQQIVRFLARVLASAIQQEDGQ
jgi:hypothetical protein